MAKVQLLHTLQTTGVEVSALGKTLAEIDFPEVFAKKCQLILENTVFVKALPEMKTSLKEFMQSQTKARDGLSIKNYQLRTRKEHIEPKDLSNLKNERSKKITGTSLICTQCHQEGCACNQSMKLSALHDHEQHLITRQNSEDLIPGKYLYQSPAKKNKI